MEEFLSNHSILVELSVKIATCITVVISCFCAIWQWVDNSRLKRTEYVEKLIEKFRTDKELVAVKYKMSRTRWFNPDFFTGEQLERQVDRLLTYLCYMCYLKSKGVIKASEFDFFRYTIDSILGNDQVQRYLSFLYWRSQTVNRNIVRIQSPKGKKNVNFLDAYRRRKRFPFKQLLDYGKKRGIINNTFFTSNYTRAVYIFDTSEEERAVN